MGSLLHAGVQHVGYRASLGSNARHAVLHKLEEAVRTLESVRGDHVTQRVLINLLTVQEQASLQAAIELHHQQGNVGPLLAKVVELARQVQSH